MDPAADVAVQDVVRTNNQARAPERTEHSPKTGWSWEVKAVRAASNRPCH